jgi:predicted dehydrogenase
LVIVADIDESHATSLAVEMGCLATTDWRKVVARDDVEVIVVSTPNKYLMPITVAALASGKHVLVEKPMARTLAEAEQVLRTTRRPFDKPVLSRVEGLRATAGDKETLSPSPPPLVSPSPPLPLLGVGFNHRHHPAIWKAHELCAQGAIGPLMFIRAVYGHGGRPGYDKEWRADPDLAGGGELLDQGVHIVDLCRWFLGDFAEVFGFISTYVWGADRAGERGSGEIGRAHV